MAHLADGPNQPGIFVTCLFISLSSCSCSLLWLSNESKNDKDITSIAGVRTYLDGVIEVTFCTQTKTLPC